MGYDIAVPTLVQSEKMVYQSGTSIPLSFSKKDNIDRSCPCSLNTALYMSNVKSYQRVDFSAKKTSFFVCPFGENQILPNFHSFPTPETSAPNLDDVIHFMDNTSSFPMKILPSSCEPSEFPSLSQYFPATNPIFGCFPSSTQIPSHGRAATLEAFGRPRGAGRPGRVLRRSRADPQPAQPAPSGAGRCSAGWTTERCLWVP